MEPPDLETEIRTEIQALRDKLEQKELILKYYREALQAEREATLKEVAKLQLEIKELKIQLAGRSCVRSFFRRFVSDFRQRCFDHRGRDEAA
jgi:hypothetical protein